MTPHVMQLRLDLLSAAVVALARSLPPPESTRVLTCLAGELQGRFPNGELSEQDEDALLPELAQLLHALRGTGSGTLLPDSVEIAAV